MKSKYFLFKYGTLQDFSPNVFKEWLEVKEESNSERLNEYFYLIYIDGIVVH